MDAGLMENYMVNVTRKAHSKDGDLNDLTFNLKDFKIKKEVSHCPELLCIYNCFENLRKGEFLDHKI